MTEVPFRGEYVWHEDAAEIICPYCGNHHVVTEEPRTRDCGHKFRYVCYVAEIIDAVDVANTSAVN